MAQPTSIFMKNRRSFIAYLLPLVLVACSEDDDVAPKEKELLLSKEYLNGTLVQKYLYGLDRKLTNINFYGVSMGLFGKTGFAVLSYNEDGSLAQYIGFNKDYEASLKYQYSYDPSGRLTRRDYFSTSIGNDEITDLDYYTVYAYNASNQLIKETFRRPNNEVVWYSEFTYDEYDNIKSKNTFQWDNDESEYSKDSDATYEHEDKSLPQHWKIYMTGPLDHDFYFFTLLEQKSVTYYTNGNYNSTLNSSKKVYNDHGYLISQVLTAHNVLSNGTESTSIYNYSYEYTE